MAADPSATDVSDVQLEVSDEMFVEQLTLFMKKSCLTLLPQEGAGDTAASSSAAEEQLNACLSDPGTAAQLKNFLFQSNREMLLVVWRLGASDGGRFVVETEHGVVAEREEIELRERVGLAFLKADAQFKRDESVAAQLFVCHVVYDSPLAPIYSYVRDCFLPLSRTLKKNDVREDANVVKEVEKKMALLEAELSKSSKSVSIPNVDLLAHEKVASFAKARPGVEALGVDEFLEATFPGSKTPPDDFATELQDIVVKDWTNAIRSVTDLVEKPRDFNNTRDQRNFWQKMSSRFTRIEAQINSAPVRLTLELLNEAGRVQVPIRFRDGIALGEYKTTISEHIDLLNTLPVDRLSRASNLNEIVVSVKDIFRTLDQIRRLRNANHKRVKALLTTIAHDVVSQIKTVLGRHQLMRLAYDEFQRQSQPIGELVQTWETGLVDLTTTLKMKFKLPASMQSMMDVDPQLQAVHTRIKDVRDLRSRHHDLEGIINQTLSDEAERKNALERLDTAYQHVASVDVMDISLGGADTFAKAVEEYEKVVESVDEYFENKISTLLRAADAKKDYEEMFRVCIRFKNLLQRERIRSAVDQYRPMLIQKTSEEIEALKDKFKTECSDSNMSTVSQRMSSVRDFPPVAAAFIYQQQMKRQLDVQLERIESVLGTDWYQKLDGKRLHEAIYSFKEKLNPDEVWKTWAKPYKRSDDANQEDAFGFDPAGRVLTVESKGNKYSLEVSFPMEMVTVFKEVQRLSAYGINVPWQLKFAAKQTSSFYPMAMRLREALSIYMRTCARLEDKEDLRPLASAFHIEVQRKIEEGVNLCWDSHKLTDYVDDLGALVFRFQDNVDMLFMHYDSVDSHMQKLASCNPDRETFKGILAEVQAVLDIFDEKRVSNLAHWVRKLDQQVEALLVDRLNEILRNWKVALDHAPGVFDERERQREAETNMKLRRRRHRRARHSNKKKKRFFSNEDDDDEDDEAKQDESDYSDSQDEFSDDEAAADRAADDDAHAVQQRNQLSAYVPSKPSVHTIVNKNQALLLDVPIEKARLHLSHELQMWLGAVLNLPRFKLFWTKKGNKVATGASAAAAATYANIINRVDARELSLCFAKIEEYVNKAAEYVGTWLKFQALWQMNIEAVMQTVVDDLDKWEALVAGIQVSRATFETDETEKKFGPIVIKFDKVRDQVNARYDFWKNDIVSRLGNRLSQLLEKTYRNMDDERKRLETATLDFSSPKEIVTSLTLLNDVNEKVERWKKDLDKQERAEKMLTRNRFLFPDSWLSVERVKDNYSPLYQLLKRKKAEREREMVGINAALDGAELQLQQDVAGFLEQWAEGRPTDATEDHGAAQTSLRHFHNALEEIEGRTDILNQAQAALNRTVDKTVVQQLNPVRDELNTLMDVWDKIGSAWDKFNDMRALLFATVTPLDLRRGLKRLEDDLRTMPNYVRTHPPFEHLTETIKRVSSLGVVLTDLKSGVLRNKHHKQLLKDLNIDSTWRDLTVGMLWDCNLRAHLKGIRYIIDQAQGESALEEFLAELSGTWEHFHLELVDYRGKCFLIRNWDTLFEQLTNHLSDLSNMKQSPYFAAFERDANEWEERLNHGQAIFEVFTEVQRRWVYLEGIFTNSTDVQQQLVYQFQRFRTFDREFVKLMREMKHDSSVLYWINPKRALLSRMEQYAETLNGIQKALGEYLEKQRAAFPRFYFVGDEDLLEIIGNARNPVKIIRHLPKMFAGLHSMLLSENGQHVHGMASSEGEEIRFVEPVSVADNPKIQDWLGKVQEQMQVTLATQLESAVRDVQALPVGEAEPLLEWIDKYPAQVVLLATQVEWSQSTDRSLEQGGDRSALEDSVHRVEASLQLLAANIVLPDLPVMRRKKFEQLMTELVHQRDVTRSLLEAEVHSNQDYRWLKQVRFYFRPREANILEKLQIRISRASFFYGFEYLGVGERLVQTPLTDRVYLTLAEALHMRMGGNPYGPAGTGKTETVKALGSLLGRFTLVFNCDASFQLQAMGRILIGLCQCGAWGCFDEFNRLEERALSAVSQQILTIQNGLRNHEKQIRLLERDVSLNDRMGVFVTMNPGYAGRSNLPDNLKQLFRGIAMISPDKDLIGQVMLYAQGFRTAEYLAGKVVLLFSLCRDQLSSQSHYDFGLRALKSVLRSAGVLKRTEEAKVRALDSGAAPAGEDSGKKLDADHDPVQEELLRVPAENRDDKWWRDFEQNLLIRSIGETLMPKLVARDTPLFETLLQAVFPTAHLPSLQMQQLRNKITELADNRHLLAHTTWLEKCLQLYQISCIHHGIILVGPSGAGKSTAWRTLLAALEGVLDSKSESYVIDPKALSTKHLYGSLDPTTLEWTDGVFTHILRKIIDNARGESSKTHWIVFDGDVDPDWAENLNSVLDDNKVLTLPNGERLALPPNVRILFEAKDLQHATPATVSRCGMVWFSRDVVTVEMTMHHRFQCMLTQPITSVSPGVYNRWRSVQQDVGTIWAPFFEHERGKAETPEMQFILRAMHASEAKGHVMEYDLLRMLSSLFSLLKAALARVIEYNDNHSDFPLSGMPLRNYASRYMAFAVTWAFAGDMSLKHRLEFCEELHAIAPSSVVMPPKDKPLIDYAIRVDSQEWELWADALEMPEIEPHKIVQADMVIDTVDTTRHTEVVSAWLADHRPLILCGPPGSGKSMTLTAVLRAMPDFELVTLNFSSTTSPELLMRSLDHYCRVDRTPSGLVMQPAVKNKWIVIFCDEINLPANDDYGTQHVITFLRQITEQGGFWRGSDLSFVRIERIQIVGACNPPTDAGRVAMSPRFKRHTPLLFVDFPAAPSLKQIYGTFNRGLLKLVPALRGEWENLTDAMIEFYSLSQERFTPDMQPHYIYSPRELTRWVRAMYEAMKPLEGMSLEELVRLWLHEALRLFQDRLVDVPERAWTDETLDKVAVKYFQHVDSKTALVRPVLFSNWLTKKYVSVDREPLREHVLARLHVFNEEVLDVKLVIFDEVLDHILRIDRVLRQPLGHLLLVGASGSGKTILSKFVSWMNGMSSFQIKVHKKYTAEDFDRDLRAVLIRAGTKEEKITFIFDESNVLDTAFLERMNALLASGEVPGLFEDADFKNLMVECRQAARRDGLTIDTEEELYAHFCKQVQYNLHVVFTMNPSNDDFHNRRATSPALFNRCVVDWFGEWSASALNQVGYEFTRQLDLGDEPTDGSPPPEVEHAFQAVPGSQRAHVVDTLVFVHESVFKAMEHMARQAAGHSTYVTPRHYLDFINHYKTLYHEKKDQLNEQQVHLNQGLTKLKDTEVQVQALQAELGTYKVELDKKNVEAKAKLDQMVVDQREAETTRDEAIKLGEEIRVSEENIEKRRQQVEGELEDVQPALEDARSAVEGIKQSHLDELRRLPNPPAVVQMALEPIMMMVFGVKHKQLDWGNMKKVLRRTDFTKTILEFDTDTVKERLRARIEKDYVSNPDFNFERVNHASKACGPLVKWLTSQLRYSQILNSIEPLRNELHELEEEATRLTNKQAELTRTVDELEVRIAKYTEEYQALVTEAANIKKEMSDVETKVTRSRALIENLSVERDRWEADAQNFRAQVDTVVGDALVAAGFLAYVGYFNQQYRQNLVETWKDRLEELGVQFSADLSLVQYLSTPKQRLAWQQHKLPQDELCQENAIMMHRFNRYPLLIDPSGQGTEFLMEHYKDKKIVRTSFLDDSFLRSLESALRFGNALLVEDVESMDPVLNSVLNREITRTGGRVMITVGDKEIDFSPSFVIMLSTRDSAVKFTPDLCSRVTFVSFNLTQSSLTTQCLTKVLRAERPDVEAKRTDQLKLQGEFRFKLRSLEEELLTSLNNVRGNILDDDTVMNTLETLKSNAEEVQAKMADSEHAMEEIAAISSFYEPFARTCAKFFFSLENMQSVHFLYQFSLSFFLDIVAQVLGPEREKIADVQDPAERLRLLANKLFWIGFDRVGRGLLQQDQVAFAFRLAQLATMASDHVFDRDELDFFCKSKLDEIRGGGVSLPAGLEARMSKPQRMMANSLAQLPNFNKLAQHMRENEAAWVEFSNALKDHEKKDAEAVAAAATAPVGTLPQSAEELFDKMPSGWEQSTTPTDKLFHYALVCKVLRPDLVPQVARAVVTSVFGHGFVSQVAGIDLQHIVGTQTDCHTPLLLVSRPGYDPSGRVDQMALSMGKRFGEEYLSLAMGSPEGYAEAEKSVQLATKRGTWILLKNVHLASEWLTHLEKTLHMAQPHRDFRLFLSSEMSDKLPPNLLRMSNVLIFEPPLGIKSSLVRSFNTLPEDRVSKAPVERSRLYFMVAWVHGIIMERLRYAPVGWSKRFEFGETDLRCALDALDEWVDKAAQGRRNVPPASLPWDALREMLTTVVYGGRIDNPADQATLDGLVEGLFNEHAYDAMRSLCEAYDASTGEATSLLAMPDSNTFAGFKKWVKELPTAQSPEVLGLSQNAELMLLIAQSRNVVRGVNALQEHLHDEAGKEAQKAAAAHARRRSSVPMVGSVVDFGKDSQVHMERPAWMLRMAEQVGGWLEKIPRDLVPLERDARAMRDPLFRALDREFTHWLDKLQTIVGDLKLAHAVLLGKEKPNNTVRDLFKCFRRDQVPAHWQSVPMEPMGVALWLGDFDARIAELVKIHHHGAGKHGRRAFWLAALSQPEAFVAATRQAVAQAHGWSLEELVMDLSFGDAGDKSPDTFAFTGFTLYGASLNAQGALGLTKEISTQLPTMHCTWRLASDVDQSQCVSVPVYLNASRQHPLFAVKMPVTDAVPTSYWAQRAVAMTVWHADV